MMMTKMKKKMTKISMKMNLIQSLILNQEEERVVTMTMTIQMMT